MDREDRAANNPLGSTLRRLPPRFLFVQSSVRANLHLSRQAMYSMDNADIRANVALGMDAKPLLSNPSNVNDVIAESVPGGSMDSRLSDRYLPDRRLRQDAFSVHRRAERTIR